MHSVFFWLPGVCIICTFACKLPYCLIIEQNHYRPLKISLENQADPGIPEILGFRVTIDYWKQQQQWSLLNRFRTEQGHCGACRRKWRLSDYLCPCGETQTMSHIVESCHLTKLNGGLSRLHSADEDAVSWLTNYGKWHAYEKKKTESCHEQDNKIITFCTTRKF